jgi:hypothetical protein
MFTQAIKKDTMKAKNFEGIISKEEFRVAFRLTLNHSLLYKMEFQNYDLGKM